MARRDPLGDADLSGPYRAAFDTALPHAKQVADPFHVVKLANSALDEVRRRVQNQTLGHRGHKHDPLYRARKLLVSGHERISGAGEAKLLGLLDAGDPTARSATPGTPKKPSGASTASTTPNSALSPSTRSPRSSKTRACPPRSTGSARTLWNRREQISKWHTARVTNGHPNTMSGRGYPPISWRHRL